ncbi:sigma-70 family RNA polymerase sigma factor [Nocardioides abyssi]|uniref:Sigma-70 family RNA polymerase sigma factor n=1 Tax=Nocardioides abyssi TaxID=3058370 RepID=A0ABT8EQB8_9ACTN|nr:sigma-70 family RNA polymerase sigma factor [Nocardioides abyssi]MDN4160320.1 sigma-70 family RNA polymerase sigma factor [Nocardioides abyssi]
MDQTAAFEAERPRLVRLAARVLADHAEAEDVVQQAWLRLHGTDQHVRDLPAWLTTTTTRLCLDRLRAKVPVPEDPLELLDDEPGDAGIDDPADRVVLAEGVGVALQAVLDRLSPGERVAFVLHDSLGFDFAAVAAILDTTPVAARKLASRARTKVTRPAPEDVRADAEVVDAFLAAARGGDLARLLGLLAPDVVVAGDRVAVASGTPERVAGREAVAAMFDGAAKAALPMYVAGRPGAAWVHRGETRVAFDFTVVDGMVARIDLRAEPELLAQVVARRRTDG